ncbi:solute carrier organic anion transporter family member 74D-like isoform X2 [Condylostylus longicornis]|uniref:solute carrier organic anion transporter family member 74D-like isoform X2 n=1 Tax=Condylostylus longicornis TaxID=2530218 RepID=UPI00244E0740|nr:solute carrier organic anion transporter family member 74D-like isoform X2 [Condylostylus longicornis]
MKLLKQLFAKPDMPLSEDTTCGFWIFKGSFLQRFANKKAYVIIYGIVGLIFSMTYAYFNGTITTIEKRFKIPSKSTGIITVGNDISQLFVSAALSYYAGKGHRPRWIGIGLITIVAFCFLTALPHFIYGPGEDALMLTKEYGTQADVNLTEVQEKQKKQMMCNKDDDAVSCISGDGNLAPQIMLFMAQFISGIGGSLYYTLGVSYMDDNIKKSKTPALLSLSYFMRMLGPALGYALASFCLRIYIVPYLHPVIKNNDPRWLGAWWLGWIILGILLIFSGLFLSMFPKQLPRAAARKAVEKERQKQNSNDVKESTETPAEHEASFKDMIKTFKRLITNKTFMYNNIASIFYFFGYMPYWIFTPKYIEVQYRQSAATSSLVTGTVALAFSAIGVLLSGFIISKYKPRARYMAAWNVACGLFSVLGMVTYAFLGCPGNENSMVMNIPEPNSNLLTCNSLCQCDYVRYSPVCGQDGQTYISPCHAGCEKQYTNNKNQTIYYNCACISSTVFENNGLIGEKLSRYLNSTSTNSSNSNSTIIERIKRSLELFETTTLESITDPMSTETTASEFVTTSTQLPITTTQLPMTTTTEQTSITTTFLSQISEKLNMGGQAIPGACPVDCFKYFVMFLSVMCFLKFIGATGRASNFLVSVRCVPEQDKTAAMGLGLMMMSLFAFIPSPIFFGWVLDSLCLVWGKTCSTKGNCWYYNAESLRYKLNLIASVFVTIGTLFDVGVWYYVKDLKIFDIEVKETELKDLDKEEETTNEKKVEI